MTLASLPLPSVSVIVPVYNGGDLFARSLDSLLRAQPAPSEIIVVADGDADGSWRLAECAGVRLIRLDETGGPSRARNHGARAAAGDVLLFIDSDVAVPPNIVDTVATQFAREASLSAVIGSYDDEPAATNFLSQYKNLLHHYVHQSSREQAFTFWGACGAVRREIFFAAGGFDESYRRPSIEDIEFGYRLRRAGYRIRLVKELRVKHLKNWRAWSLIKSDVFDRALPWTELALRERYLPCDLNVGQGSRLSALLSCALVLSLFAAVRSPTTLLFSAAVILMLLALNARLYLFFYRRRGAAFTLAALPWHWFYYVYAAVGFVIGSLRYFSNRSAARAFNRTKPLLPVQRS